ncbi:protein kinase [Candidatus Woesearchaeota archaeon]|jgi:serine/threonine protein kinase|nr:protein kinase [Candidatus Woesearchaeota archaeon]MBT4151268.1 protein kinase [Candidatus Woesearchaeota archaeon]MBT4247042.1 protein kinase [Candidatus Woesearchaeota archaeon]MBT4433972.1 protein kinase [Candidatus Woesearchaeota archaeon]MBT7332369.1 protein kinase [Candidatus Woesearchaeota archaeon]
MDFRDKYQIVQMIGRGLCSTAFLVTNKYTDQICVAKRTREPKFSRLIEREAGIIELMHESQSVVELIETIQDRKVGFSRHNKAIILGYSGQKCLAMFLKKSDMEPDTHIEPRFSQRELSFYAAQLISGISHVHAHGYIHGDLKPSNIIRGDHVLRRQNYLRIIDFSGCRHLHEVRECHGTLGYQASEQKNGITTFETDYYGIGVTLNSLAEGRMRSRMSGPVGITKRSDISDKFKEGLSLSMSDNHEDRIKGLHLF